MYIYIDAEFDAIKVNRKYQQCVIAIGAIACNSNWQIIDTFESCIRPKNFHRISKIVSKLTNLNQQDIMDAPSFHHVMDQFGLWMQKIARIEEICIFSFGPDDQRTLLGHASYESYHLISWMQEIKDAQKEICGQILFNNEILSLTLSLDDVKAIYGLEPKVYHKALQDAKDLMQVHQRFRQKFPIHKNVTKEIYDRIQKSKEESNRKQYCVCRQLAFTHFQMLSNSLIIIKVSFLKDLIQQQDAFQENKDLLLLYMDLCMCSLTDKIYTQWNFNDGSCCFRFQKNIYKVYCYPRNLKFFLALYSHTIQMQQVQKK